MAQSKAFPARRYDGTKWIYATPYSWDGKNWVDKNYHYYDGNLWSTIISRYDNMVNYLNPLQALRPENVIDGNTNMVDTSKYRLDVTFPYRHSQFLNGVICFPNELNRGSVQTYAACMIDYAGWWPANDFSVEMWIANSELRDTIIISYGLDGEKHFKFEIVPSEQLAFFLAGQGPYFIPLKSGNSFYDNIWHQLVLTRSSGTGHFYFDAVHQGSIACSSGAMQSGHAYMFGGLQNPEGQPVIQSQYNYNYYGYLAALNVYGHALSATQIGQLFSYAIYPE